MSVVSCTTAGACPPSGYWTAVIRESMRLLLILLEIHGPVITDPPQKISLRMDVGKTIEEQSKNGETSFPASELLR